MYQEYLYGQLAPGHRLRLHRQIGERLETGYGEHARTIAAALAEHFVRGRDAERSVRYLQFAGEQALQRSAHYEALNHLNRGLALLPELADKPTRLHHELELLVTLGPALIATKGLAAAEVEQTYARARDLCREVGQTPQLFPTLWGLGLYYLNRGPLPIAQELGEQLYELAQAQDETGPLIEAHDVLGHTLFYMGDYPAAQMHLARGRSLIQFRAQPALASHHDVVLEVTFIAVEANTLWCLGYPEQAVRRCQDALELAQSLDHSETYAAAQHFAATLYYRRREPAMVQMYADALIELARDEDLPLWERFGTCRCRLGHGHARTGRSGAGDPAARGGSWPGHGTNTYPVPVVSAAGRSFRST